MRIEKRRCGLISRTRLGRRRNEASLVHKSLNDHLRILWLVMSIRPLLLFSLGYSLIHTRRRLYQCVKGKFRSMITGSFLILFLPLWPVKWPLLTWPTIPSISRHRHELLHSIYTRTRVEHDYSGKKSSFLFGHIAIIFQPFHRARHGSLPFALYILLYSVFLFID